MFTDFNENLFSERYRIKSARLLKWNYSSPGYYFVTICTFYRENFFSFVKNNKIILSNMGDIIQKNWQNLPNYYSNIKLDEYIVMPNHFHGIIHIVNYCNFMVETTHKNYGFVVETIHELSLQNNKKNQQLLRINRRKMLLSKIIGRFKMQSSKEINILRNMRGRSIWQPRYHDRIIRNEKELNTIRQYIKNNLKNWEKDRNNIFPNLHTERG